MRATISLAAIAVAIAVGCMPLFVLIPTQPEHIPYTAISKDGSTNSGVQSLLERWNKEINGRLRWLSLVSPLRGLHCVLVMPRFLEPGIKVKNPASPAALRVQDGAAARKKEPLAAIRSAGSAAGFPAKRAETIGRVSK